MSIVSENHKNSKKVVIRRVGSFISRLQNSPEMADYYASTSVSIGSYWASSTSKVVGTGLTRGEESLLLPDIIGLESSDKDFRAKVKEFFNGLDTKVPASIVDKATGKLTGGITLEIGLEVSNELPVSAENFPLEVMDYIRYRHALGHPFVADSYETAAGNQRIQFYVDNPYTASRKEAEDLELTDKALSLYLSVKDKEDKVNMSLTLLGKDFRDIEGVTEDITKDLRKKELRALVTKRAAEYIKIHEDKDFDIKYTIQALLNTGVLRRVGAFLLITETGEKLGTEDATVLFFKDEEVNSQTINILKTKLQEALKKSKKGARK